MAQGIFEIGFFLGTNTPTGYVSFFSDALSYKKNKRVYVLKGASGIGKSTLLKSIGRELAGRYKLEKIYCSGDTDSLDGLILKEKGVAIVDGTPPHAIEPKFFGALEKEVNLGEALKYDTLYKRREEIISLGLEKAASFDRASRFLGAASSLMSDSFRTSSENVNEEKAQELAERIAKKEIPPSEKGRGNEMPRFLSTLTDKGIVFLGDTISSLCDRIYAIEDESGAASRIFLRRIRDILKKSQFDFYTCYCPFSPFDKIDHIIIPELRLGFSTRSKGIASSLPSYRTIHARRFNISELSIDKKRRLKFNRNACDILLKETSSIITEAKALHKRLEAIYGECMDFSYSDKMKEMIIKEIDAL